LNVTYERMAAQPEHGPVHVKRLSLLLIGFVVGSTLAVAVLAGVVVAVAGRPHWWAGWATALLVSLVAAMVSLVPAVVSLRGEPQLAVYGYVASAVLRTFATLGGGAIAVMAFRAPALPTLLLAVPLYLAQLVAEVIVLGRAFIRFGSGGGEPRP
jgi:hypothetical protein